MAITFPVIAGCWYRDDSDCQHDIHSTPSLFYQLPAVTFRKVLGEGTDCIEQGHPVLGHTVAWRLKNVSSLWKPLKSICCILTSKSQFWLSQGEKDAKSIPEPWGSNHVQMSETGSLVFQTQYKVTQRKEVPTFSTNGIVSQGTVLKSVPPENITPATGTQGVALDWQFWPKSGVVEG